MPGMVEQRRAHAASGRPGLSVVVALAVGMYSIVPAIISTHFFGLQFLPHILALSAAGFAAAFVSYFRSPRMRDQGFKRVYMGSLQVMGDVVGRGILVALYYTVFLIPGVPVAAFSDRLQTKRRPARWADREEEEHTIERAREQW